MRDCGRFLFTIVFVAVFCVATQLSFAQEAGEYTDQELVDSAIDTANQAGEEISVTPSDVIEDADLRKESGYSREQLLRMRKNAPEQLNQVVKDRKARLENLRKTDPEKYKQIITRLRAQHSKRMQNLKEKHPERYKAIMEKRKAMMERKQHMRERKKEKRNRLETDEAKKKEGKKIYTTPKKARPKALKH